MKQTEIKVIRNISQLMTLHGSYKKDGRKLKPEDLGLIENAALVFNDEKILWVGQNQDLPNSYKDTHHISGQGYVVTPELVDCHTHIVFGGNRAAEYTMRLNGADYQAIAKAGGGILFTAKNTNLLNQTELFELGKTRIQKLKSYGIGTIEIKSGYGLNFEKELELSVVIDRLKRHFAPSIQIKNTFMAAHAIPPSFESSTAYLNEVVLPLLEKVSREGIIDAVDIFHETGYFNTEDTKMLFQAAMNYGIHVKIHADEFQDNGGAKLATEYKALSADHLLCTSNSGIKALAASQTVAVLLPGTGFFLGKPQAKARDFLDAGVKVAIGSDYNPGSCHWDNLLAIASIAGPTYKLNIAELWSAITLNSSHALGLKDQGAIVVNLKPRFSFFKAPRIDEVTYNWGTNLAVEKLA